MKKAIVIAITMMLGLGLTAFAGPLSGSWASTLVVDPAASIFTSLCSTLAVDYTVSGWTFGSSSKFTLSGFSKQSFTAGGSFGAFTLSSTMTFNPMFVTARDYSAFWLGKNTQTPSTALCPITYTTTTKPRFLTWKTEGSISIGGVELGALFYIDNRNVDVTWTGYIVEASGEVEESDLGNKYVCQSGKNGSGWRFKVAGSIGDITATSYTYFNLEEGDASTKYCPAVGKGGALTIVGGDCDPSFYEEYILLEGIALGCATIDAGLSILCDGFGYASFVVSDVAIGGWLELDFGLKFTTTLKSTDFCLTVAMPESDCFIIEFGLNSDTGSNDTGKIDSIDFYGIGFSYAWEAITFTSHTELSPNSALFSSAGSWSYLNSNTQYSYLVPYVGRKTDCTETDTEKIFYWTVSDGYYELKCVYTERYKLWEKFIIDIDGDACCGGALDLTINTWFGDHQTLSWDGSAATYVDDSTTNTTLFNWAKTEVDASVGVASNITLDLGFNVSAFGWESLEVGFTFVF